MERHYFCDYCNRSFVDELQARKRHLNSIAHKNAKKAYYNSIQHDIGLEKFIEEQLSREECYAFLKKGNCNFGDNCYRSHYPRAQLEFMKRLDTEVKRLAKQEQVSLVPSIDIWTSIKTRNSFYKMLEKEEITDLLKLPYTFELPKSVEQFSNYGLQTDDVNLDTWA